MKPTLIILAIIILQTTCNSQNKMNFNKLTHEEESVILKKGTEYPFTGKYWNTKDKGTYTCRQCDMPLYRSDTKFDSNCGWPSFDDEIAGAVIRKLDADGKRTEILCAYCGGHLGHVFEGENFTDKNTRHCVNSISMQFVPDSQQLKIDRAIFASGCFWGTEYYFQRAKGVISTRVGFIGDSKSNPSYKDVCTGTTGHAEAVEVIFDPSKTNYTDLVKYFFETHDFTQINRQGPDIGEQYRSEIFYTTDEQRENTEKVKKQLQTMGYKVASKITKATTFWKAEDYHQLYYDKKNGTPYCHIYKKIF